MRAGGLVVVVVLAACGEDDPTMSFVPTPDAAVGRPTLLSQTGLYRDFARRELNPSFEAFAPTYVLWSDGALKRRWVSLPPGGTIDQSDPEHWQFPVGTRFFKEFSRDGVQLETRLIERTGPGPDDYWMGAFVWLDDGSDAVYKPDGAQDIRGTDHDAPSTIRCGTCHQGEPGRILGYSKVQREGTAPGAEAEAAALGYLHANCGHCHNQNGSARPDTNMILRLRSTDATVEDTDAFKTTVGVRTQYFNDPERTMRISAGNPDASAVFFRMTQRGSNRQMPPIATEHVDETGVALLRTWIESLP